MCTLQDSAHIQVGDELRIESWGQYILNMERPIYKAKVVKRIIKLTDGKSRMEVICEKL